MKLNVTMTLITLSFRRKPESSQNDLEDDYFDSMAISGLLDTPASRCGAGSSSPA